MIKNITKKDMCDMLNIPNLSYSNFILHWTDYEDTSLITNLCYGKQNILEIGTYLGYTSENIARNNIMSNITTIDICKDYNKNLKYQNHELLDKNKSGSVIQSKNVSHKIISSDEFFLQNNNLYDVILIDGDHSRDQVIKDTENAFKYIKSNGIIIWHDVYNKDNSCPKCLAEPDNDDVGIYLREIKQTCFKIDKSWVAFYVQL